MKITLSALITTFLSVVLGLFSVLCQLCFLLLMIEIESLTLTGDILFHRYFSYVEYPLTSLILLLGGALLFRISVTKN